MGVRNIITFDAHDPRVQNAVPLMSFDNAMPTYQVLKSLLKKDPDLSFDKSKFTVVSPDEGAMNRNMYFSSVLGCNLGMFYKRRDYTRVVNGRNPIVAHEYLGESVEGKTVFIADDIIASGESMLEVASNLKERGAANIIANATFPLFTSGLLSKLAAGGWAGDLCSALVWPGLLAIEYGHGRPIQRPLQLVCISEALRLLFWLLTKYAGMSALAFWTNIMFVLLACARGWAALVLYKTQEETL